MRNGTGVWLAQMFPSVNMEWLRFAHLDVSKCTTTICAKKNVKKLMEGGERSTDDTEC